MNDKLAKLQEQINLLVSGATSDSSLTRLQAATSTITASPSIVANVAPTLAYNNPHTSTHTSSGSARPPQYMGPTSSAFGFAVARNSLQEMGIQVERDPVNSTIESDLSTPARTPTPPHDLFASRDPLTRISFQEARRLVELYEEESGTVYPFIDIQLMLETAQRFYNTTDTIQISPARRNHADKNKLSGGMLDILKLVIAIASVFEGHGPTVLSRSLLDSVESGFQGRLCGPTIDVLEIQAWTLMVSLLV